MKILIAGATGLIGSELVKLCLSKNIHVHYLTTQKDKIVKKDNYKGFYWNPKKQEIDLEAFNSVETIINLAGAPVSNRWTKSYKEKILKSRIETANLLYSSLKNNKHAVTHYISSSGISIYPSSYTKIYTEKETEKANSFLGMVVEEWEKAADIFKGISIKVSKVRTGIVLSEKGGALLQIVKPVKFGLGAPLGKGKQWQSWIHNKDMAGILYHIIAHKLEGTFNAVAPNPVTQKEMLLKIAKTVNRKILLPPTSKWMLKIILGELAEIVLESQYVQSKKIEENGYKFQFNNLEMCLKDLL